MYYNIYCNNIRTFTLCKKTSIEKRKYLSGYFIRDLGKRIGLRRITEEDLQEQYDIIMRSKYKNPVEQLPEKVDELVSGLQKVIITYTKFELMKVSENNEISSISSINPQ
jgi:hypothetical protein